MQPAEADPLVKVTWHVPRSTLARLKEQSRLSGAPVAEVVRRALLQEAFPLRALDAATGAEVILPEGVGRGSVAGTEVVGVVAEADAVATSPVGRAEAAQQDAGAVRAQAETAAPSKARGGQGEVAVTRPKVRHHDDEVIAGGAMVKCRRCTLVKTAARPEVCDG